MDIANFISFHLELSISLTSKKHSGDIIWTSSRTAQINGKQVISISTFLEILYGYLQELHK
jgi:hypothetical protein